MYMKTELLKVIEGGLEKNPEKVKSYAKLISEKLKLQGEEEFAERILKTLDNKGSHPVYLDEFLAKLVDNDSRLDMVDVSIETDVDEKLILPDITRIKVESYIQNLKKRDKFIELGLNLPESLLLFGPSGVSRYNFKIY